MNVEIIDNKHIHGKNLRDYTSKQRGARKQLFENIVAHYENYRNAVDATTALDHNGIRDIVSALNNYRRYAIPVFDSLDNAGQKALGYTIMEEFFYLLFSKKEQGLLHLLQRYKPFQKNDDFSLNRLCQFHQHQNHSKYLLR